ncbi:MAG: hypothetical protein JWP89_2809 [Schlesneria sp.]|nr:hypothetical protein [Schlesneria sp.]
MPLTRTQMPSLDLTMNLQMTALLALNPAEGLVSTLQYLGQSKHVGSP